MTTNVHHFPAEDQKPVAKAKRELTQSSIAFPYSDLDNAIGIAQAMHKAGGVPLSRDQLAGQMGLAVQSGNFVNRCGAAKMFGLIEMAQGKYHLTELGFNILDSSRERAARVDAFLNVALYKRTYEEYKGKLLPPRPLGLENAFLQFGVAPKQVSNARYAFDRSATQAGFLAADKDKLIAPILSRMDQLSPPLKDQNIAAKPSAHQNQNLGRIKNARREGFDLDPLVEALLSRLPAAGEHWEIDAKVKWLQTLAANLTLVYPSNDTRDIKITTD